ncbi:zinc finger, RING/FYVE/PHD-type containing protein [Tanacetum coccineum]
MAPIRRACKRKIETGIGNDLGLSLALPGTHIASASQPNDDDLYSDMMEQFKVKVLDVCRKKLEYEVNKTKAVEVELRRVEKLYHRHAYKTVKLEDKLHQMVALQEARDSTGDGKEEVGTSNTRNVGIMCRKCESRMANTAFFPCRHLCVCMGCYHKVKVCPICDAQRSNSSKVDGRIPKTPCLPDM